MDALPYISAHLPGISGRLREQPEDFVVEEIPAYLPAGRGEHTFLRITKRGMTSTELQQRLARLFHLSQQDIGMAGLKDRHAVTTQWISIPRVEPGEAVRRIQEALPKVEIHEAARHVNKLKPGHLRGNRFRVRIRGLEPGDKERAEAIAAYLKQVGVPNYYGPQRFGRYGDNAHRGRAILLGQARVREKWLRRFLLSAYQAALFNRYLALRVASGLFTRLLPGDIAKKADTGGLFVVEDPEKEQPRYAAGEIHFTGPMYGYRMWWAEGPAGELERRILAEESLTPERFRQARLRGTRRLGRLWLSNLQLSWEPPDALVLTFTLPKGAYATTVLREFLKNDATLTGLPEST